MSANRYDVVVCGAGPVGCVAALAFAHQGKSVLVLEADPRASDRLAGEWLHPNALAILETLGVDLAPAVAYATGSGFTIHPEDGSEPIVLPYPAGKAGFACEHALLVETLRAHVEARATVELVPWARVRRIDGQVVTFEVERPSGAVRGPSDLAEGIHSVRADLVVGATGRGSLEQGASNGSTSFGGTSPARVYSRTIGLLLEDVRLPFEGHRHLFVGAPGPVIAQRIGPRSVRLLLDVPVSMALPPEATPAFAQVVEDAYRSVLPKDLRGAFRRALAERRARIADNVMHPRSDFGREGLALVGDAVGAHHPLTALGLTMGFEDAMALSTAESVSAYARDRALRTRIPEMLAIALHEVFADHAHSSTAVRQAVYHLFRKHPGERLRTMGFLVGEGGRARLAGSFLGTVAYGSNELVRRGLFGPSPRETAGAMADLGKRLATLLAGTYHLTDALSAVTERRLAARVHGPSAEDRFGAFLRASRGGAAVAPLPDRSRDPRGTIERALEKSVRALVAEQDEDGSWEGEVVWCPMLAAQYVLAMHAMGRPLTPERRKNVLRHFEDTRLPGGAWALHELSKPYLFVTILVYVASRLLGVEKNDPLLTRAYEFLRAEGGAAEVPSWGKLWLAIVGLYEWKGVAPVPAEAWLLPEWVPAHPSRYYCHTRLIYMAMSTVQGSRFVAPLTPRVLEMRDELFPGGWEKVDFDAARSSLRDDDLLVPWTKALSAIYAVLARFERVRSPEARAGLLANLREHIRYELRSTHYTCISPVSGLLNMIALHAADPNDPDLLLALEHFDGWIWEDAEKGARVAGARSASWDTGFASQALAAAAPHVEVKSALVRADEFLASQQIQRGTGREAQYYRIDPAGGYCFAGVWHGWPVSDCTAEAILGRMESAHWLGAGRGASASELTSAVRFILRTQNSDGGFGSYEARRVDVPLEWMNPAEMFADSMTEKSYVECTSSCVSALAMFRTRHPGILAAEVDRAIARGVESIRSQQRADGSWPAMWGVHFVYGTMFGVRGLVAAGVPSHDPAIRRACAWLLARQRPDGGWGEHWSSGEEDRYVEHTETQTTQTAWALLTLADAEEPDFAAMTRAASLLARRQSDDGTWPKQDPEGVFFRSALLDYVLYRRYFPVWALGAYESRRKSRTDAAGLPTSSPQPTLH